MSISRYQKNLPLFASYLHLQGNIILRRLLSSLKLGLEILCFYEWKVLAWCIRRHAEVFFPFLRDFLTSAKIIPPWARKRMFWWKGCFGIFANSKSFLNGIFTFLTYIKTITWILKLLFSFSHTYTQILFSARGYFFHCLSPFSGFFFPI